MNGALEEQLSAYIKARYGDMKSFAKQANIPNSTLHSMFQRGILKSSISNVIQMAQVLNISVDALAEGRIVPLTEPPNGMVCLSDGELLSSDEVLLIENYRKLNNEGKSYIQQTMSMAVQSYSGKNNAAPDLGAAE